MYANMTIKPPNRFVGLHAHSNMSIGDAIGLPQEHIEFALNNGMDGLCLTDHGNQNGLSHQQIKAEELKKKGIKFKAIPGIEAYYVDSLSEWENLYRQAKANGSLAPKRKSKKTEIELVGNEQIDAEELIEDTKEEKLVTDDDSSGTVIEDEGESKSNKYKDPIKQRNHLVVLPKNSDGLKSLFKMCSESYIDGFYKYPRIDLDMIRKHAKGNLIATSACIAGNLSKIVFDNTTNIEVISNENFELIQKLLKDKVEIFMEAFGGKENFYPEIQMNKLVPQHLVNMHLIELSKRHGYNLVVTCDSHYSNPKHWREREIYKAMAWASKTKGTVELDSLPKTIDELKCELYPKNAEQVWDTYKKVSDGYSFYDDQIVKDAIERTHDIAHNLIGEIKADKSVKLPSLSKLMPQNALETLQKKFEGQSLSEDDLAFKELVRSAIEGLKWRKKDNEQEYISRLKRELEDIKYLQENSPIKFARYFLTYKKIIEVTSEELFVGNGRGSVSGSLLAYVLNISQVDPIKFGTIWERFISKKKMSAPDIDQDWSDRDKAVKLLAKHFGEENVIPVSNFVQLQLRSLIKDLARLHNLPFEEINTYTSKIENEVIAEKKKIPGFDRATWVLTFEEAEKNSASFRELFEKYPELAETVKVLFKQMRSLSRHAGGAVITDNSREAMPLIKAGGELQTPWPEGVNYRHLEEYGILKFDILGLGTLRMFEDCIRKILIKEGNRYPTFKEIKKWFDDKLHPDNNNLDDINVYKTVYWKKKHAGTFQFVSQNVQDFMTEMKPKSIMDIAIATSIFRPGPLALKVDRKFLNNRANPEDVIFKHPLLKEVYADTSGLLIFQEQLMTTYNKLCGVPLEDTDKVRKAFTKKEINNKEKAAKDREELRTTFQTLSKTHSGLSTRDSGELFDEMEKLVAYSFNSAHAIAYAITSYQCAWFQTYYPDEWNTTYLDYCAISKGKVTGKEDPKAIAIKEIKALGYGISKPDINNSSYEYTMDPVLPKTIVPSFGSMKYVGKTVMGELNQFRPYVRAEDLLINPDGTWRHSKLNKRALSTLIKLESLGSLDIVGDGKLFKTYKQAHTVLIDNYDELKRISSRKKNNDVRAKMKELIEQTKDLEEWTNKEKIEFSQELAGSIEFDLIVSPETQKLLEEIGAECVDDFPEEAEDDDEYNCWAIINSAEVAQTKTGKGYLKLKFSGIKNQAYNCNIWGYKDKTTTLKENDVIVGTFKRNKFGFSCFPNKIFKVN